MAWVVFVALSLVFYTFIFLRGEDLTRFDSYIMPRPARNASPELGAALRRMTQVSDLMRGKSGKERLLAMRESLDSIGGDRDFGVSFHSVEGPAVRGEWVLAPGVDPARRLLYIHGGAYMMGSPTSHRAITSRLSSALGVAVFSLDYRLMPEHGRQAGIEDCREAWRWLQQQGPEAACDASFLAISGDSAGGNLTLSLLGWIKRHRLRQPDCAIALSPVTDALLNSPSLRSNIATDAMLGPQFGKLAQIPIPLLWWAGLVSAKRNPGHPDISPTRGDLSGLPPVLIQASESEMLVDDSRRYAAKALASGSPVELQLWPHMPHVWQIFDGELPEAEEAFQRIAEFVARVESAQADVEEAA